MTIKAQSADGMTHEFPDETAPEVVDKAMQGYAESIKDKSTTGGQVLTGMMDPVVGGAQLAAHVPHPWRASVVDPATGLDEAGRMDERVRQRETGIQAQRGNNTSLDWPRMAGNVLSPANFIGAGVGAAVTRGTGMVANIGRGIGAGAASGALQPATESDFAFEKSQQTGVGALLGGAMGAVGGAASKAVTALGDYLARNLSENLQSAAVQKILRRIKQDEKAGGPGATDVLDLINESNKPVTMADTGGANVRALAGNVARQPGEGRQIAEQTLDKRDEQAAARLSEDIARHVSGGPTMHQATEALLQARSAAGRPAYQEAHALQGVWSPRLEQFIQDPAIKAGLQRGYELERLSSLAEGRPLTATQMGVDIDIAGNVKLLDKPNMLLLDMGKRGLDAMIGDERNELTGRLSARGVALEKVRRAYVDTIDDLDKSGAYKKARALWAGHSQSLDAIRMGRSVLKVSPEENQAAVEGLSPATREFGRLGVADLLKERLAKAGLNGDEAKQLVRNPWMRDQLRPWFKSSEDFDHFVEAVTTESKMFETRSKVLRGSDTAARRAEDETSNSELSRPLQFAEQVLRGHPLAAAKNAYQMWRDLGLKPNPELNAKIAKILFTSDVPEDVASMLKAGKTPPIKGNMGTTAFNVQETAQGLAPAVAVDATKERNPQGNIAGP